MEPLQARVVTKFCFDFNPDNDCQFSSCPNNKVPGHLDFELWQGSITASSSMPRKAAKSDANASAVGDAKGSVEGDAGAKAKGDTEGAEAVPDISVALLDDEYISFPMVAQVWDDVDCKDVLHKAKRTFKIDWRFVENKTRETRHEKYESRVVERLRPRWWYVAIVSCSRVGLELSYHIHMTNPLKGAQSEISIDAQGVIFFACLQSILACSILMVQLKSARMWAAGGGNTRRCCRLHPALLLLTAAAVAAACGSAGWLLYFGSLGRSGTTPQFTACLARVSIVAAKTLISLLLLLLARGQCVCTPEIEWRDHKELVAGLILFGFSSFWLETWGESDLRNMTTEYTYDTHPGTAVVAADLLFLYLYASRSFATWQAETRVRPRLFYRRYAAPLTLWFAALPIVALVATFLMPWVRFKVTFAVNSLVLPTALGLLVYSFQPTVAPKVYDVSTHDYEPVNEDELANFLKDEDDDML